ncbi:MAG: GNAT family N-acetyltransferase [Deltaproteobacteria bacterium]|nr:GNAT family N-acetyltransferase [Deltaproteobacteria bacterium]
MTNLLSERLDHRPMTEEDWPFFLALNQDRQVVRYVADDRSEAAIRQLFDVRLPRWEVGSPHWLCWVIRERSTGERVGVTGLIDRGEGVAEVGFLLASAFHGKGYGIESLRLLCRFAFAEAGFRKLSATVTAGNAASKAVLQKAGFVQEGTLRESYLLAGRWQDDWLFGLLQREFP